MQGLKYLKAKGAEVVELTVDAQNRPARAIYRSFEFKPIASKLLLEKKYSPVYLSSNKSFLSRKLNCLGFSTF